MRTGIALVVAAGMIGTLAACSSPSATESLTDTTGAACVATVAGAVSDAVSVTGEFGAVPKIDFATPVTAETTERTVLIAGEGAVAGESSTVMVEVSLFNGTNGEEITTTGFDGSSTLSLEISEAAMMPGLVKTLQCSNPGTRVVGVIPPVDGYGEAGREDLGVSGTDSLVFVADVVEIVAPPEPIATAPYDEIEGMPGVEFDADGVPTITIPDATPPTVTQIGVIEAGDGEVVAAGADVTVHYRGVNWNTGVTFDDSWVRGEPATFNTGAVINGFRAALEGQSVGSKIMVVVAPIDGYGPQGGSGEDIGAEDTLVFVIEIISLG